MPVKKMGIEGVGPKIMLPAFIVLIAAYFITKNNPATFEYSSNKASIMPIFWVLLIIGLIFWLGSVIQFLLTWKNQKLATRGFYAIFLNPIYDSFIFFVIPAISLYLNSWLYLAGSMVLFIAMLFATKDEENYLRSRFGQEYDIYRDKVLFKF